MTEVIAYGPAPPRAMPAAAPPAGKPRAPLAERPLKVYYTREGLDELVSEFKRIDTELVRRDELMDTLLEQM